MRPGAVAVGGYYPTPQALIPPIARHLRAQPQIEYPASVEHWERKTHHFAVVDPCAGEGSAVVGLIEEVFAQDMGNVSLYACEMEATRFKTLQENRGKLGYGRVKAQHGDSFRLTWDLGAGRYDEKSGASLGYFNPPYDHETIHKRLEEKWLRRFSSCLMDQGVLAFVVPYYALSASAETIGREFTHVQCYRFPDGEFEVFRQVVLFGVKRPSLRDPDPQVVSLVQGWAESVDGMPALGSVEEPYTIPGSDNAGFAEWRIAPLDVSGLLSKVRPWFYSERSGASLRPIAGCVPGDGDLLTRKYPVAMPPKPAHIAAGIAAGVFNGARVESGTRGLPALYVKGVFNRDFVTVDEKSNKDGDKTGEIQVQQPKLVVTALDLGTGTYHTLKQSGDLTGSRKIADFTTADLLEHYGPALMQTMLSNCPVLHDHSQESQHIELPTFGRPLYRAQSAAVMAAIKLLGGLKATKRQRRGTACFVLGEIGCLRGDTPIHDPVTGDTLTVAERHALGLPFHVWALGANGPEVAPAFPPVRYPVSAMVKVTMANGSSVVVTPAHRFWDGSRWIRAREVAAQLRECGRALLATSSGTSLSAHARGVLRWSGTTLGSQGDCHRSPHSHGEPLRCPSEGGRVSSPSRDDAPARSRSGSLPDEPAHERGYSRLCPLSDPRSTTGCALRTEGQPSSRCRRPLESHPSTGSGSTQEPPRPLRGSCPARTTRAPSPVAHPSTLAAFASPEHDPNAALGEIASVEPVDAEHYYDFHVPGLNNYWACDMWHHNSGKSACSLAVAASIGARRVLVMCPPHLLQGWTDQVKFACPEARVQVLESVADVDSFAACQDEGTVVAILSRETAKLGHSWVGVAPTMRDHSCRPQAVCPRCGHKAPWYEKKTQADELARTRARCQFKTYAPGNRAACVARELALAILPVAPTSPDVRQVLVSRVEARMALGEPREGAWGRAKAKLAGVAWGIASLVARKQSDHAQKALTGVLVALGSPETTEAIARRLYVASCWDDDTYGHGSKVRVAVRNLLTMLPVEQADRLAEELEALGVNDRTYGYGGADVWRYWRDARDSISGKSYGEWSRADTGELEWNKTKIGSQEAAIIAQQSINQLARFSVSEVCGEPLYQAIPEPRRYPLATYLTRKYPALLDLFVADECFVAGTMVSGREIETIKAGELVESFDEKTGRVASLRVTRLFVSRPSELVRVSVLGSSPIHCTPGHPFFTKRGWVPAAQLTPLDEVARSIHGAKAQREVSNRLHDVRGEGSELRPNVAEPLLRGVWSGGEGCAETQVEWHLSGLRSGLLTHWAEGEHGQEARPGQVPEVLGHQTCGRQPSVDREVPHVRSGDDRLSPGEGREVHGEQSWLLRSGMLQGVPEKARRGDRADHCDAGQGDHRKSDADAQSDAIGGDALKGERCHDRSTTGPSRRQREADACAAAEAGGCAGVGDRSGGQDAETEGLGLATALQDRHRKRGSDDRDRGGRGESWPTGEASLGRSEGRVLEWTRVDRVEVLERGSDGTFGGVCPDGLVYNLEVEEHHTYIANGVVVHNCHEFASGDSAQSFAAHRFTGLGIPTLLLTGSIMNGYAESLFTNQWALDPNFRQEFTRSQRQEFVRRYGYLKQLVEDKDKDSGKVVAFGSQSDRVERTARTVGNAPGVLPLFVLRYLLRRAVTIHKADLALDLPKCREIVEFVEPAQEQLGVYQGLLAKLKLQIKSDRFKPDLAGKLWGQMAEIPSYLDRATRDTGNVEDGRYVVAYPESCQGKVVAEADGFSSDTIMPKEQWMLDTVERELAEGRRVMVFAWHSAVLPRLQRLIAERTGEPCPLLDAGKVQAAKRQAWIDKEVIGKGRRTLVVNPVAVQTGLNNLVWFASEIWMQNPACNPIAYRQAVGRVDRIGQKIETRIYFPVYSGTAQVQLHKLLMHKVGVSLATDGLDAGSALAAAGVGSQGEFDGFAVGKVLFDLLEKGEQERPRAVVSPVALPPRKQLTFGF